MDVYKQLKEERAAKIEEYNSLTVEEMEARKDEFDKAIEGYEMRLDAEYSNLQRELKSAEINQKASEFLPAESKSEEPQTADLRALIHGELESRATVEVPTFLDATTVYGKKILPTPGVEKFLSLFNLKQGPYKAYTETLHALGAVTFADATEVSTLTDNSPTISQVAQVSVSKKYALASLSNEVIEEVPGAESDLVAEINQGYAREVRKAIVTAINASSNSANTAAADATVAEAISLFWDTLPAEDKDDVIFLASASAMSDLGTDAGNDNFFYDPTLGTKVLQGRPVYLAPGLGAQTSGDTLIAAVDTRAIDVRVSGLRLARDASALFTTDSVAFRGTAYLGAAINSTDHVALLKKGA